MGIYSDYVDKGLDFKSITAERKRLLTEISSLRGNRDILVYASDISKGNAPISIDFSDIIAFQDQLANLKGDSIDIIIETPGGIAEVVEDLVRLVRAKYKSVGVIVPGYSKSAGTIFAMAGDEILMGETSALGPIDAQIYSNGKRFSAEAFLEGLNKIKLDAVKTGLNLAFVPILQNISPGEIQHCENAQNFSKTLVSEWLAKYKFQNWSTHSSSGKPVTDEDKKRRAEEIGSLLCNHSKWLTHSRSIKIEDFEKMKLQIIDFSKNPKLNDAILRYYALLRLSFDSTGIYKIFETTTSQITRFISPPAPAPGQDIKNVERINFEFKCDKCSADYKIQVHFKEGLKIDGGFIEYPFDTDIFKCKCGHSVNLSKIKLQIEAQTGQKIIKNG